VPSRQRLPLRRVTAGLALTALLTGLAACGGDDEPAEPSAEPTSEASDPTTSPEPEPEPEYWPLTGLELEGDAPDHPVLVVKVDNTPSSSPQVGLGKADLVVEELVEGGVTRLAAFYYSTLPKTVGPIRSMRASDIGIVPGGAQVITSGAANVTLNRVRAAGIPWITEGAAGIYRDSSRSAPYNLFSSPADIGKKLKAKAEPDTYLDFGSSSDLPKGAKARAISANFGNHTTSWQFQGGRYVNTNSYAAEGDQFPAQSVLVLRVQVGDAGYRDPAGYPVPETKLEGQGKAQLFHDGRVVQATWKKSSLKGQIELSTKKGELAVPAGRTWIELVPAATGNVTWTK